MILSGVGGALYLVVALDVDFNLSRSNQAACVSVK